MADILLTVAYDNGSIIQGVRQIQRTLENAGVGKGLQLSLGRISGKATEFQKSLDASSARVIAFGATAGVLNNMSAAFKRLVASSIEVEHAITEINTLLNLSSQGLVKFTGQLFDVANATGQTFLDAAKAAQEFSRQGLSVEQTLQRTQSALTLTRLSGLQVDASISALTATMNSFRNEALSDIEIINRLANVDAKFAVSSADLAEALKRVGGSAADAGVQFNQVIALVTSAQQATARGGAVIGNSFKTIFTRLQRPAVLDDLEQIGISVRKANGENINLIEILRNLAVQYDSLSSAQKSFVTETVGGVYQINILKSILGDLGHGATNYEGALDAASNATAAADLRSKELDKTLSSLANRTLNNLTKAFSSISKITIEPTIRGGLTAFSSLVDTLGGAFSSEQTDSIGLNIGRTIVSGIGKGFSNILTGPGIQFAIFGLIKLFQRLQNFAIDSVKDLTGVNKSEKERAAIEQLVVNHLTQQKGLIEKLRTGETDLLSVQREITKEVKASFEYYKQLSTIVPSLANKLQGNGGIRAITGGSGGSGAASGFVPNLNPVYKEIMGARAGGYNPGKIVSSQIRDGSKTIPIIANSAESKSSIKSGGKVYEWINPPKNSPAGRRHAYTSKIRTGIDPYELSQNSLMLSVGFVPNLSTVDELPEEFEKYILQGTKKLGIDPKKLMERGYKPHGSGIENFVYASQDQVLKLRKYSGDSRDYKVTAARAEAGQRIFEKLNAPFFSPKSKPVRVGERPALLQDRVKGKTIGEIIGEDDDYRETVEARIEEVIPREKVVRTASELRTLAPALDYNADNFVIPYEHIDAFKKILENANNKDLFANSLKTSGIKIGAIDLSRGYIPNLATKANDKTITSAQLLAAAKSRLDEDQPGFGALFEQQFASRPREPFYNKNSLAVTLRGILKADVFKGRYKDPLKPQGNLIGWAEEMVKGLSGNLGRQSPEAKAALDDLPISDVKAMLELRGREFVSLAGFYDFQSKKPVQKTGETFGMAEIHDQKVKVPFRYTGLKNPQEVYDIYSEEVGAGRTRAAARAFGTKGKLSSSNESTNFGDFLNDALQDKAIEYGVRVGLKKNDNLDILGYDEKFVKDHFLNIDKFAAADIKGSVTGDNADSMAKKIARVLAFKRGAGDAEVPLFNNIKPFTGKGKVGFLSQQLIGDNKTFDILAYAALATGKPFKTQVGAIGSGKLDKSLSSGAAPVLSREDIPKFDEFIFNTDQRQGLSTGLRGIAIASSSQIVGLDRSKEDIINNIKNRMSNRHPLDKVPNDVLNTRIQNIKSYSDLSDYGSTFKELAKRLGSKFSLGSMGLIPEMNFAEGFVPNLARKKDITLFDGKKLIFDEFDPESRIGVVKGLYKGKTSRVAIENNKHFKSTFAHEEFGHGMFKKLSKTSGFQDKLRKLKNQKEEYGLDELGRISFTSQKDYGTLIKDARNLLNDKGYKTKYWEDDRVIEESFAQSLGLQFPNSGSKKGRDKFFDLAAPLTSPNFRKRFHRYMDSDGIKNLQKELKTRVLSSPEEAGDFLNKKSNGHIPNLANKYESELGKKLKSEGYSDDSIKRYVSEARGEKKLSKPFRGAMFFETPDKYKSKGMFLPVNFSQRGSGDIKTINDPLASSLNDIRYNPSKKSIDIKYLVNDSKTKGILGLMRQFDRIKKTYKPEYINAGQVVGPEALAVIYKAIKNKKINDLPIKGTFARETFLNSSLAKKISFEQFIDTVGEGERYSELYNFNSSKGKKIAQDNLSMGSIPNLNATLGYPEMGIYNNGLIPNLAKSIPTFPEFSKRSIKGKAVRLSSTGRSDDEYETEINEIINRLSKASTSKGLSKELDSTFGKSGDYRSKIGTLYSKIQSGELSSETLTGKNGALRNNIKGFLGERDFTIILNKNKIDFDRKKESEYIDFLGNQDGRKIFFENKNQSRIGKLEQISRKFHRATKLFGSGATKWIIGNNDTVLGANGTIPNLSPRTSVAENEGYTDVSSARASQLKAIAFGFGIDEENPVKIVRRLSREKPDIYKKLTKAGLLKHQPKAEGLIPNLSNRYEREIESRQKNRKTIPDNIFSRKFTEDQKKSLRSKSRLEFEDLHPFTPEINLIKRKYEMAKSGRRYRDYVFSHSTGVSAILNNKGVDPNNDITFNDRTKKISIGFLSNYRKLVTQDNDMTGSYAIDKADNKTRIRGAREILKMFQRGIKKYGAKEIDAGEVIGPDVIPMLERLGRKNILGVPISGLINSDSFYSYMKNNPKIKGYTHGYPPHPKFSQEAEKLVENIGIESDILGLQHRDDEGKRLYKFKIPASQGLIPNLARKKDISLFDFSPSDEKARQQGILNFPRAAYHKENKKVVIRDGSNFNSSFTHEEFGHGMFAKLSKIENFQKKVQGLKNRLPGFYLEDNESEPVLKPGYDELIANARNELKNRNYTVSEMSNDDIINESFAQYVGMSFESDSYKGRSTFGKIAEPLMPKNYIKKIYNYMAKGGDGLHEQLKERVLPGVTHAKQFFLNESSSGLIPNLANNSLSNGFVPNLNAVLGYPNMGIPPNLTVQNLVKDALRRENRATGGNAVISQSSKLISSENPYGLAAIDRRSQRNANEAIDQHLALGQNISQIKKAKTSSSGHVPNLAIDAGDQMIFSAILAALQNAQGSFGGDGDGNVFKEVKSSIASVIPWISKEARMREASLVSQTREMKAKDTWVKEYQEAKIALREGSGPVEFNTELGGSRASFRSLENLTSTMESKIDAASESVGKHKQALEERRNQTRKFGLVGAIGGGLVGGIASTAAQKSGAVDLSASIDIVTSGIQNAGQSLAAFPGRVGKMIAGFSIVSSLTNSVISFSKALDSAQLSYERQQASSQKFSSLLQTVSVSLNNLNSMVLDSNVTLEALNREHTTYRNALTQLKSSSPKGEELAGKIEIASTNEEKNRLLGEARKEDERKLENSANLLQIQKLAASRSLPFIGTKLSGGIFAGKSTLDRETALSSVRASASNVFSSLDENDKIRLAERTGNDTRFESTLTSDTTAAGIIEAIKDFGGTQSDIKLFLEQVKLLVNNDQSSKRPELVKARKEALEKNNEAQFGVDHAVRNETALRRLFINSNSIRSSNSLNAINFNNNSLSNQRQTNIETLRARSGRINLLYGEETSAANETNIENQKISSDRTDKLNSIKNDTSRKVIDAFSLNLDSLSKPVIEGGNAQVQGSSIPRTSPKNELIIEALSKGLSRVTQAPNGISGFIGQNGQLDFEKFEKEVISNSGAGKETEKGLKDYLIAQRGSMELLKAIEEHGSQTADATQDFLKQQQINNLKLNEIKKEIGLRRDLQFLGGTDTLNDRGKRRQVERDIIRGGRMLDTGPNAEVRAQGASLFLKSLKANGQALRIAGRDEQGRAYGIQGDAMSQKIAQAMNIEAFGNSIVKFQSAARIQNGLGFGGARNAASITSDLFNKTNFQKVSALQVANEHKAEGDAFIKSVEKVSKDFETNLSSASLSAQRSILGFSSALDGLRDRIATATKQTENKRQIQKDVSALVENKFKTTAKKTSNSLEGSKTTEDVSGFQSKNRNISPIVTTIAQAALSFAILRKIKTPALQGPYAESPIVGKKSIIATAKEAFVTTKDYAKKGGGFISRGVKKTREFINTDPFEDSSKKPFVPSDGYKKAREAYSGYNNNSNSFFIEPLPRLPGPLTGPILAPPVMKRSGSIITPQPRPVKGLLTYPEAPKTPVIDRQGDMEKAYKEEMRDANLQKRMGNAGLSQILANDLQRTMTGNQIPANLFPDYKKGFTPEQQQLRNERAYQLRQERQFQRSGNSGMATDTSGPKTGGNVNGPMRAVQRNSEAGMVAGKAFGTLAKFTAGTAAGYGGYAVGSALGENLIGDKYGIGSQVLGAAGMYAAPTLASKAFSLFKGVAPKAGAFGALAGSPLAAGGLAIGTAYAGFKLGQGVDNFINRKDYAGIDEGFDSANNKTYELATKRLKAGKSTDEVRKDILAQIKTDQNLLNDRKGGGGFLGDVTDFFTNGKTGKAKESIAANEKLLTLLESLKGSIDEKKNDENSQDKLVNILEKLANGSSKGDGSINQFKIEISLKDIDKAPKQIEEKIIRPLEEKLRQLADRTSEIERNARINPKPASI